MSFELTGAGEDGFSGLTDLASSLFSMAKYQSRNFKLIEVMQSDPFQGVLLLNTHLAAK